MLVFNEELLGQLRIRHLLLLAARAEIEETRFELAAQAEIPVLGEFLRSTETVFFQAVPMSLATDEGDALSVAAFRPFVDSDFSTQDWVLLSLGFLQFGHARLHGPKCGTYVAV